MKHFTWQKGSGPGGFPGRRIGLYLAALAGCALVAWLAMHLKAEHRLRVQSDLHDRAEAVAGQVRSLLDHGAQATRAAALERAYASGSASGPCSSVGGATPLPHQTLQLLLFTLEPQATRWKTADAYSPGGSAVRQDPEPLLEQLEETARLAAADGGLVVRRVLRPRLVSEGQGTSLAFAMELSAADGRHGAWTCRAALVLVADSDFLDQGVSLSPGVDFSLREVLPRGSNEPFWARVSPGAVEEGLPTASVGIDAQGLQWRLDARALPGFVAAHPSGNPWLPALLAFGLAASMAWVVQRTIVRRLEAELGHDQQLQQTIHNHVVDAIVLCDERLTIRSWSQSTTRLLGYTSAEAHGQGLVELVGLRAPQGWLKGELSDSVEVRLRARDGHWVEALATLVRLQPYLASSTSRVIVIRDLGFRRQAEQQINVVRETLEREVITRTTELESARRNLQTILDALPSQVVYWDSTLTIQFANRAFLEFAGRPNSNIAGTSLPMLNHKHVLEPGVAPLLAAIDGHPQQFERSHAGFGSDEIRHQFVQLIPDTANGKVVGIYQLVQDVTEQTIARQLQAAATEELRNIMNALDQFAMVSICDDGGKIVEVNARLCQVSGYARDELIGRPCTALAQGSSAGASWIEALESVRAGFAWVGELQGQGKDGAPFWVDCLITPLANARGPGGRYVSVMHDITYAKRALQSLDSERARLENTLAGTNVGTWESVVAERRLYVDRRWCALLGYAPEEIEPVTWSKRREMTHPEDIDRVRSGRHAHEIGLTEYFDVELRLRHRDGHWVWCLERGRFAAFAADGKPVRAYGTLMDITALKLAQLRIAESEAFLESAQRAAGVGGWQVDLLTRETRLTPQAMRVVDWPAEAQPSPQMLLSMLAQPEARDRINQAVAGCRRGEPGFDLTLPLRSWTGRDIWVQITAQTHCDADGPAKLVGAVQDVTRRELANEALRSAMRAAESASDAKSAFLANMSHEIRTPLNAVIGLSALMVDTGLNDEQRSLVGKIQLAGRTLLGLVNNVLDLSKIEAGAVTLEQARFSLRLLVEEVVQMLQPQAEGKAIDLFMHVFASVPNQVTGDATRVKQIVVNLASNAIKFTARGQVAIRVAVVEPAGARLVVRLSVTDTGPGLTPQEQATLFRPFTQADASTTRRHGGTGLGLSIVRHLAELMGGTVGVNSELGRGSEFWAQVQLQAADDTPSLAAGEAGLVVLLVHEPGDPARALGALVERLGWTCKHCDDAQAALAWLGAGEANAVRQWVVMAHWRLERLADLIRWVEGAQDGSQRSAAGSGVVIVGSELEAMRATVRASKLRAALLQTPADASDLYAAVNEALIRLAAPSERAVSAPEPGDGQALQGLRILVVDDSDANLEVAQRVLQRRGATVHTCTDGAQAVQAVKELGPFDAVLMDMQMPVLDGIEATRAIRSDPSTRAQLVIALTAGALTAERHRALEAGMDDFLTKPLEPAQLVSALLGNIGKRRGVAQPAPMDAPAQESDPADDGATWPTLPHVDPSLASRRLGGDLELFFSILQRVLHEHAPLWHAASTTMPQTADQRLALAARVHKLRGSIALLGVDGPHRQAGELEQRLRGGTSNRDSAQDEGLFQQFLQAMRELEAGAKPLLLERARQSPAAQPSAQEVAATADDLRRLARLLREQDFAAADTYKQLARGLGGLVSPAQLQTMDACMTALDFAGALRIVEEATPHLSLELEP